ncbi:MAG: response regulator [Desulfobacterales bacterium]|nr:response regulator [Desulfobacterales bacterium]
MPDELIMIVEDEAIIAVNIKNIIEKAGYPVLPPVSTGKAALALVDSKCPDLVLMDINLIGKMNGIETAEQIREKTEIPIVYLTAHSDDELIKTAWLTEPYGYLIKPVDSRELLVTIKMALYKNNVDKRLRENEKKLAVSNKLLSIILEHTPVLTAFMDNEFNFIKVNRAYAEADLHDVAFFSGKNHFELYPDEENKAIFKRVVDTGEPFFIVDKPFDYPDNPERGTTYWDWSLVPVKDNTGNMNGLVLTLADVTQRKLMEEEKKKFEKQSWQIKKSESLGRMAGAIAHNFNNQLGVVIGNLEMVMDDLPSEIPEREKIGEAYCAANLSADISRLMLAYLGQTAVSKKPVNLSDICRLNLPLMQEIITEKILLETELMDFGPTIFSTSDQIKQTLTHMVTNAAEAIGDRSGNIAIRTKLLSKTDIPEDNIVPPDWQPGKDKYACLEVTDSGCGIDNENLENIFDPFFTTKFSGRGLGLAVVFGMARQINGALNVESRIGAGTTFKVFFPVAENTVSEISQNTRSFGNIRKGNTLLFIDDEAMIRNMASKMISRLGYSVLEAMNGEEAIELFIKHQNEINCVITDLTMPNMDGWQIINALCSIAPDIPIIMSSGYDEAEVMKDAQLYDPIAFLHKPYVLSDLKAALDLAINKS